MTINLIPADLEINPLKQPRLAAITGLAVTTDEEYEDSRKVANNVRVNMDIVKRYSDCFGGEQLPLVPAFANMWGYLRLHCNLTGRNVFWEMPVTEGLAATSINQSDLVGQFADPMVKLVSVFTKTEHMIESLLIFESREAEVFSKEYASLALVQAQDNGYKTVHVFHKGKSVVEFSNDFKMKG